MKTIGQLYEQWQSLKPLKEEAQARLDRKFNLEFNYNSNHLEGNTLTYGQTELLLMFGETSGDAKLRDYEEMNAHNVALKMVQEEAKETGKPLTEKFIRDLNELILVKPFYKDAVATDGSKSRIKVNIGGYKTRPNHVVTATGETFYYATPEETPAMMTTLVAWYNEQEEYGTLNPLELASLFHYRFIRIHPFEDGNGRIARLLVNYVLMRHDYPMVIIKSERKEDYLKALHRADVNVGLTPSDGANAELSRIEPFLEYMKEQMEYSLELCIKAAKGESLDEMGDWSKKLQLKLKSTKTKHTVTLEQKQKVIVNSFYKVIKAIDTAFIPFEQYFAIIEKQVPGAFKTIEDIKTHNLKGIARLSYNAKYQAYYNKPSFSFEVMCKFDEEYYSISVFANGGKYEINSRGYEEYLSEEEIKQVVEYAGNKLSEFIDSD